VRQWHCTGSEEMLSSEICNVDVRETKKTNTRTKKTNVKTNTNTDANTKKTNTKTTKKSYKESIRKNPFGNWSFDKISLCGA